MRGATTTGYLSSAPVSPYLNNRALGNCMYLIVVHMSLDLIIRATGVTGVHDLRGSDCF